MNIKYLSGAEMCGL